MTKGTSGHSYALRAFALIPACLATLAAVGCAPNATDDVSETVSAATATTANISGVVTGPSGALAGATVSITNGAMVSALTDAAGKYSFTLAKGKTYTVTA